MAAWEAPEVAAITRTAPLCEFAVKPGEVATPLESVIAVAVPEPPNVTLGPLEGAVNVTDAAAT